MQSKLSIKRYPSTQNRSLQAWNSADEHILKFLEEAELTSKELVLYNDRFGYLACHLEQFTPLSVVTYKSQEKAIANNLDSNGFDTSKFEMVSPISELSKAIDLAIIKIPKSSELFRLYLTQLFNQLTAEGTVVCGFMTKYFNKQILEIAGEYFEDINQSQAWKKSRILVLKKKKEIEPKTQLNSIAFDHPKTGDIELKQYPGVFSASNVDHATQFLIDHLTVDESDKVILDLASGNGVLGLVAQKLKPDAELHLLDDSWLAVESSRLNVSGENTHFHYEDTMDAFEDSYFDLVVSNPPFHFDYEINIEVPIQLFKQVHRCLKTGGKFKSVASKHLNFKTHLDPIFSSTRIVAEHKKFVIYESIK